MSKIGIKPITIPEGVEAIIEGQKVTIKGSKWELSYTLLEGVKAESRDNTLVVSIDSDEKKNLRGLSRTLIANMIEWVSAGYEKKLLIMGVGYAVKKEGHSLDLALGFSHKVIFPVPESISFEIEQDAKGNFIITFQSIDKQHLWQVVANIRALRPPEPYKWKGIRYFDEFVKIKPGKAAVKKA